MVHPGSAVQPFLKGPGIFPDVMGIAKKLPTLFFSELCGKHSAEAGSPTQMGLYRLFPPVRRNMRKPGLLRHKIVSFPASISVSVFISEYHSRIHL